MRFNIVDPFPHLPLGQIPDLIDRATSWIARAAADPGFDEAQSIQTIGVVHILQGMDYHYRAYAAHEEFGSPYLIRLESFTRTLHLGGVIPAHEFPRASADEARHLDALNHEAIAYLNRLGQFYYFARRIGRLADIPRLCALIPFRNKHGAHRSIDAPMGESTAEQNLQAMAFSFSRLFAHGVISFQIPHDGKYIEFCLPQDHPTLLKECTDILFSLHKV